MDAKRCDRCGRFYMDKDGGFLEFDLDYYLENRKRFDLCSACVEEIDRFLGEPKQFEEDE